MRDMIDSMIDMMMLNGIHLNMYSISLHIFML